MNYSRFMYGLKLANIDWIEKVLADMAMNDPNLFESLANISKSLLKGHP